MEIWKPVVGYENYYIVSNQGQIASVDRYVSGKLGSIRFQKGIVMTPQTSWKGYACIVLHKDGIASQQQIHRLVAWAFIENPSNLPQVNHMDCNKKNNHVSNLEWITNYDNMQHAVKNNCFGEFTDKQRLATMKNLLKARIAQRKKVTQFNLNGEPIKTYESTAEAQRVTNVNNSKICACCKGKRNKAGGYQWRYYEEDLLCKSS